MIIGGGAGSTAGGVKLIRAVIAYKWIRWSLRRNFLPSEFDYYPLASVLVYRDMCVILRGRSSISVG
jgi:Trk-type K+ transport system membrane component